MSSSLCYVSFLQVKHPKRKLFRSNDPLLSVFMWGINHTVKVVIGWPFSCMYLFLLLSGAAACEHPSDAHARRLPGLLQGEDWQPCLQQGEPAQPLQDQGVLPPCLQKPQGAVRVGWHGVSQLSDQVTQGKPLANTKMSFSCNSCHLNHSWIISDQCHPSVTLARSIIPQPTANAQSREEWGKVVSEVRDYQESDLPLKPWSLVLTKCMWSRPWPLRKLRRCTTFLNRSQDSSCSSLNLLSCQPTLILIESTILICMN